jgi:23S rRNA pseudoU1915 N3-methylase RlmH
LNPLWNNLDTNNFSSLIENKKIEHKHIILIIGGAYWLNYKKLKSYIDLELNISKFTLPHSLALLVLLEQLYRINMIKKWSNYHK